LSKLPKSRHLLFAYKGLMAWMMFFGPKMRLGAFLLKNRPNRRELGGKFTYEFHSWFLCKIREPFISPFGRHGTFTA